MSLPREHRVLAGKKPEAIFLRAGDRMAGSVEGLGRQEQTVVSDPL